MAVAVLCCAVLCSPRAVLCSPLCCADPPGVTALQTSKPVILITAAPKNQVHFSGRQAAVSQVLKAKKSG